MKLKEIKPGMVIHWKTEDEKVALLEELERLGYIWYGTHRKPTEKIKSANLGHVIFVCNDSGYKNITHSNKLEKVTHEFSDLIIPEMSAEEVLQICSEICNGGPCDECIIGEENCFAEPYSDKKKVIEICQKWKSDHEKKEPEIEWVYRVFGVENNGEKFFQTEEEAIKRCEELAKSQKSKQYARYERVCRVKAVE